MANWNGHFILTVFGDFYPALNGDFRPPLTEPKFCKNYPLFSIIFKKQALFWERCKIRLAFLLEVMDMELDKSVQVELPKHGIAYKKVSG